MADKISQFGQLSDWIKWSVVVIGTIFTLGIYYNQLTDGVETRLQANEKRIADVEKFQEETKKELKDEITALRLNIEELNRFLRGR